MSVKKLLLLSAAAGFAIASTSVLAGGPDHMGVCDAAHVHHGFYVGGGLSRSYGTSKSSFASGNNYTAGFKGWGGGVYAGYDAMVSPKFYIGGNAFINFYDVNTPVASLANTGEIKVNYAYGVALEPGYMVASNVHLFGRIGVANGNFRVRDAGSDSNFSKFGWLAGVGTDVAVTDKFSIRGQFTEFDYPSKTTTAPVSTVNPHMGEFMLGVTYHIA